MFLPLPPGLGTGTQFPHPRPQDPFICNVSMPGSTFSILSRSTISNPNIANTLSLKAAQPEFVPLDPRSMPGEDRSPALSPAQKSILAPAQRRSGQDASRLPQRGRKRPQRRRDGTEAPTSPSGLTDRSKPAPAWRDIARQRAAGPREELEGKADKDQGVPGGGRSCRPPCPREKAGPAQTPRRRRGQPAPALLNRSHTPLPER